MKQWCLSLMVICGATLSCYNPFFPPTDEPPGTSASTQRSTPLGVIAQLIDAYQKRDIDRYRDLFSGEQDFRFYVAPGFISPHVIPTCEQVDTVLCAYVASKGFTCLNYWDFSEEMKRHTYLFEKTAQITLTCSSIDQSDIRYVLNGNHETTNVEIILRSGSLIVYEQIQIDEKGDPYQNEYEVPDIGQQVFYLEKDPQNKSLWVIQKWFDLQSAQ